jgi:hypothetical protein
MDATKTVPVGDVEYTIKTRLGWMDQQRIDDIAFNMFVEGKKLSASDDLDAIDWVEVKLNNAAKNKLRLEHRLVTMQNGDAKPVHVRRSQIPKLDAIHVAVLIQEIEALEEEEEAEKAALLAGNPTETPSDD